MELYGTIWNYMELYGTDDPCICWIRRPMNYCSFDARVRPHYFHPPFPEAPQGENATDKSPESEESVHL